MKLKIAAPANVFDWRNGHQDVSDVSVLRALDGVSEDDCFADYLGDGPDTQPLVGRGITGGYLRIRFNALADEAWIETEYDLDNELSTSEIELLSDYTLGQWSDGVGENFFPEFAEKTGLLLIPTYEKARVSVGG